MGRIRSFKEIKHSVTLNEEGNEEMRLNMFIPGVNSGAYTPQLVLQVWITRKILPWFRRTFFGQINLSINDVVELRDELNNIIEEAERQRRLGKKVDE